MSINVGNENGGEYESSTLTSFQRSFQRHFSEKKLPYFLKTKNVPSPFKVWQEDVQVSFQEELETSQMPQDNYLGPGGPNVERERQLGRWESHFHLINLASVPTYRKPIRIVGVLGCPRCNLGMRRRRESDTRFKFWNKYRHGSEILNGRGQRPFSSLRVFPFCRTLKYADLFSLIMYDQYYLS